MIAPARTYDLVLAEGVDTVIMLLHVTERPHGAGRSPSDLGSPTSTSSNSLLSGSRDASAAARRRSMPIWQLMPTGAAGDQQTSRTGLASPTYQPLR